MANCGVLLIVIPARGGSKRLPRKNLLPLAGKPLISWTIETALKAGLNARVLVTSDDKEILAIADRYASQGIIAHRRPDDLATDTATTYDALIEAVESERKAGHELDALVLLQPTSPLRRASDILAAVKTFEQAGCRDTVVTVCELDHPTAWIGVLGAEAQFSGIDLSGKRSQDYQREYRLNGAVYVIPVDVLFNTGSIFTKRVRASVMPRERSVDVDEKIDFDICESILKFKE